LGRVKGEWRKPHKEELQYLFSYPNIIRVITRWPRLAVHVARTREKRMHRGFWWRNLKERNHLERLGVDKNMIFKTGLTI
jgi:hypothetical protein